VNTVSHPPTTSVTLKPSRSVSVGCKSSNSYRVSVATSILGRLSIRAVSRAGSPLKKPGRNAAFPADAEKQLHQRIVRLQVGFGLTLNHIHRLAVQICKECSMQNPWQAKWWERGGLLSEKEPRLNSEESRKSQLWPTDNI
jgi:hypothetical protein